MARWKRRREKNSRYPASLIMSGEHEDRPLIDENSSEGFNLPLVSLVLQVSPLSHASSVSHHIICEIGDS